MSKAFKTALKRSGGDPIIFTVDGEEFSFTPQDTGPLLSALWVSEKMTDYVRGRLDWLGAGLSEEHQDYFEKRLRDTTDSFTHENLLEIVDYLVEESGGYPTSSAGD